MLHKGAHELRRLYKRQRLRLTPDRVGILFYPCFVQPVNDGVVALQHGRVAALSSRVRLKAWSVSGCTPKRRRRCISTLRFASEMHNPTAAYVLGVVVSNLSVGHALGLLQVGPRSVDNPYIVELVALD